MMCATRRESLLPSAGPWRTRECGKLSWGHRQVALTLLSCVAPDKCPNLSGH